MTSRVCTVALTLLVALAFCPQEAEANIKGKIIGSWQLERVVKKGKEGRPPPHIKITMEFKKGGTWIGTMQMGAKRKVRNGTWTLTGKTLVTQIKGRKPDRVTVSFVGAHLKMTKPKDGGEAIFKRI